MTQPPGAPAARTGAGFTPTVSVVVISYQYVDFLGAAIDSALAQEPPVEVLVVDDGSTDGSRELIASYGDRVGTLFKDNGGNSSAVNAAVPLVGGQLVMFLDADDLLDPRAAAEVASAWRPGCAKVQFRLSLIDAAGRRLGVDPPTAVGMPNGDVLPQVLATGRYVTPVTTGNAFSREALEAMLPIPEQDFRNTNDGYLNPLCPFYGDIVSIDRELGSYRLHGRNLWAFSGGVDLRGVRQRVDHDLARERHLLQAARRHGREMSPGLPLRDPLHVLQRLISLRHGRTGHPAPDDSVLPLLRAGLSGVVNGQAPADPAQRLALVPALLLAAVLPPRAGLRVGAAVLVSRSRPRWVRSAAAIVRRTLP